MPLLLVAYLALGHQDITDPKRPWFPQMFPHPTGTNGYEEFIKAADLVKGIDSKAREGDTAMSVKDLLKLRIARTNKSQKAIDLVLLGISKRCHDPRRHITYATLFPELPAYRELSRLLVDRADIQFAQGHPEQAIKTLSLELKFGGILRPGPTVLQLLVGTKTVMTAFRALSDHFKEIPQSQYELLLKEASDGGESTPEAYESASRFETSHEINFITELLQGVIPQELKDVSAVNSAGGAAEVWEKFTEGDISPSELEKLKRDLNSSNSKRRESLLKDVSEGRNRYLKETHLMLLKPESWWKPIDSPFQEEDVKLLWKIGSTVDGIPYSQAKLRLQFRLLRAQIEIAKYQKAHGVLPSSLSQLGHPDVFLDPFTGNPFKYQRVAGFYRLSSPGQKGYLPMTFGHPSDKIPKGKSAIY